MRRLKHKKRALMTVPSMNWQFFSLPRLPSPQQHEIDSNLSLSDFHHGCWWTSSWFPINYVSRGMPLINFLHQRRSITQISVLLLFLSSEFIDIRAVVHHPQVNYEAANWSCANLLSNASDHHLGESRSGSDSRKGLWYSGKCQHCWNCIHRVILIRFSVLTLQMLKEYEKSALAKKNQLLHLLEI